MLHRLTVVIAFLGIMGIVNVASAQNASKLGITMGYPASIGVLWKATDRVAIRPELSFGHTSNDTPTLGTTSTLDSTSVGVGVSGLLYIEHKDALSTYFSPRYTYSRATASTTGTLVTNATIQSHGIAGLFGAQYDLGARFGVFGEVGIGYRHQTADPIIAGVSSTTTNSWTTQTGVGILLFF